MMARMPTNCIVSLREALRQAGLDDRHSSIPPSVMAERLRPRPAVRSRNDEASSSASTFKPHADATSPWHPIGAWILTLAFLLGLVPSLSIGIFVWLATSRPLPAHPCPIVATELVLTSIR